MGWLPYTSKRGVYCHLDADWHTNVLETGHVDFAKSLPRIAGWHIERLAVRSCVVCQLAHPWQLWAGGCSPRYQTVVSGLCARDCVAVVDFEGYPNSLEWATPADAIDWTIAREIERCPTIDVVRRSTRLGTLDAAAATIRHQTTGDVEEIVIAFRPGGVRIYTAHLATTVDRYERDSSIFRKLVGGFRVEQWR